VRNHPFGTDIVLRAFDCRGILVSDKLVIRWST
jgi:hypothetical protein